MPSVWVLPENLDRANQIVDDLREKNLKVTHENVEMPDWTCTHCGETIEGQFTACWKCLNPR
jgi:hypothetical protein